MARLPQGTRKRKDGSLEKRFTVNGKRYSIYATTVKELAEKEQETRERIKAGAYKTNNAVTLNEYFEEWKRNRGAKIKANTLGVYGNYYKNHIAPALGERKVKDIERREVSALVNKLNAELSATTVNLVIKILKAIFSEAVNDEIITRNPAGNIKGVRVTEKATETHHRALTINEQRAFMDELKGNYYYTFIALMLATGMRSGEVGALTWGDIDTKKNVIKVNKTITKTVDGKKIIGDSPKSDAGNREIPLSNTTKMLLKEYRDKFQALPFTTTNIFVTPHGNIIDNGIINRAIRETLQKLDDKGVHIEHFTSHAMRDTFATRYIEQGGNMKTLQTILGHSSITMTMDIYAHVLPDTIQNEMERIVINI